MQHNGYLNFLVYECMKELNRLLGCPKQALCFDEDDSYFIDMNKCAVLDIPKNRLNLSMFAIWQSVYHDAIDFTHDAIDFTCVKPELNFKSLVESAKCRALYTNNYDEVVSSVLFSECLSDKRIEFILDMRGATYAIEFYKNEKIRDFEFNRVDEVARIIFESLKADCEKTHEIGSKLKKELKKDELRKEGMRL